MLELVDPEESVVVVVVVVSVVVVPPPDVSVVSVVWDVPSPAVVCVSVCGLVSVVVGPVVDPPGKLSPIVSYIIGCGSDLCSAPTILITVPSSFTCEWNGP